MNLNVFYVGIDIGYIFHEASCIPSTSFVDEKQSWKKSKTIKFNSNGDGITKLVSFLQQFSSEPSSFCVLLEPTGGYFGYILIQAMMKFGYKVHLVENKAVKDFREKSLGINEKSDAIDCRVMAYLAFQKALTPSLFGIRLMEHSMPIQNLCKALVADRWSLQKQLNTRKAQFKQLLCVTHPELKSIFDINKVGLTVRQLIKKYPTISSLAQVSEDDLYRDFLEFGGRYRAKEKCTVLRKLLDSAILIDVPFFVSRQKMIIDDIERLEHNLAYLDDQIKEIVDSHPYKPILWSFPIKGYIWACTLVGVIGSIDRFNNYKKFKKYVGYSVDNKTSGISVRTSRLSYHGSRLTRRVLFQMTMCLISPLGGDNPFKTHYERLVSRGMPKMKALCNVAGKLAQVMYGCLKYSRFYDAVIHAQSMRITDQLE
jgi:transposase